MTKVITIDGPSGSGKGTLALRIAKHYEYQLLDSGALYRLLGLALSKQGLMEHLTDRLSECVDIAQNLDICFKAVNSSVKVYLDEEDVTQEIRTECIGGLASKVAAIPELRDALLERQRSFADGVGLVADGRDMGTVVFPQAQAKIYLTASAISRAERRVKQLQQMGQPANIDEILSQIQTRDKRDMERSVAPLKPATDAYIIDSSELSIDQVFTLMTQYIDSK